MKLKVIGTGSSGNSYLLDNIKECLIIDLGLKFNQIKKALDFDLSKVVGALQSHRHLDHSKATKDALKNGIDVYLSNDDIDAMEIKHHRAIPIESKKQYNIGGFKVMPFDVEHDVPCLGFLINHKETGNVLFLTDTMYCSYKFKNLNNIIIEANYCPDIAKEKLCDMEFLRNRVLQSHMSIDTTLGLLRDNDISKVNNIMLIHLSDSNSHEKEFKERVKQATGKNVFVASAGKEIDFNKTPF